MSMLRKLLIICAAVAALLALLLAGTQVPLIGMSSAVALLALGVCWRQLRTDNLAVAQVLPESSGTSASSTHDRPENKTSSARFIFSLLLLVIACGFTAWVCLRLLNQFTHSETAAGPGYFALVISCWLLAWLLVERLAEVQAIDRLTNRVLGLIIPLLFGAALLFLWEVLTRALNVPQVLLPSPSLIGARFGSSLPILWADFQQTFLKAALIGYAMGCLSGFMVAILIDRSPFLQKGLLPIGNLVSALPIVGVAPIMVMWFGFDWPSKAAVVVIMTFFPMLVNTLSGLTAANNMQLDLMKTYGSSYWQNLFKLRLPEAMPFIFNALKINSTLAMIGAIVAEFFGTPTVGMGFRISTEVGRMNVDMVWAEIAVAALAGSCFYALLSLLERWVTFWHPATRAA